MLRRPPISSRSYTLFPYPSLFLSLYAASASICIALAQRLLGRLTLLAKFFQQGAEVFGMLFFLGEDFFHHPTACRIVAAEVIDDFARSEEHTSELQSLMRISYAVF